MFKYFIYDENKELMRKTRTKGEAIAICKTRAGWTYVFIRPIKPLFLDAPF